VSWRAGTGYPRRAAGALAAGLVAALLLLWPGRGRAESSYERASAAYKAGQFDDAVRAYEALVAAGIAHEDLYYNLGNAYFRSGKLGLAIYNYERALRLEPAMEDAQYNLAVAREVVAEKVVDRLKGAETDPLWMRVATFFTVGQLTLVFLVLNAGFFAGLIVARVLATGLARTALVVMSSFAGATLLCVAVLLAAHVYLLERVAFGIVLADQVVMREGADEHMAERGQLHAGLRVRILGREPGWMRVRLANGVEGWLPDAAVGPL
jgi:hypothetical protein